MPSLDTELPIVLRGTGWSAEVTIAPPVHEPGDQLGESRQVYFSLPGDKVHTHGRKVLATVAYTRGRTVKFSGEASARWDDWFVKIYQCQQADVDAMRDYLHRQAVALQEANAAVPGRTRIPIEPPWAVTPVQIVRGSGEEDRAGDVATRLGAPVDALVVAERPMRTLPLWFQDHPSNSGLYLLAVSPLLIRPPWDPWCPTPAIEHLNHFASMAAGLDKLHDLGWAHCDIRPDNVCVYLIPGAREFVLVDTDSGTPTGQPPPELPTPDFYLRRPRLADGLRYDPGELRAQDRFGFALVLLTALAGRDCMERLLRTDNGERPVDSAEAVAGILRQHWRESHWQELITVLAEPFGRTGEAGRSVEDTGPWAVGWLGRLRQAVPSGAETPAPRPPGWVDPDPYADDIALFRTALRQRPHSQFELQNEANRLLERQSQRVAARTAARYAGLVLLGFAAVLIVVLFDVTGWGM
ncbi:hypothetical protein [Actinoplanes friuliensis]|uniref:Protein kinase domain-containing protein n=1 Tax=Actinoplanes friuliensis DSM 7358 TaxID=1246995 RepID=U5VXI0_9ACTN|nr:hypothetical protein [Actinoplanes friuliensis]AGZ41549.1 hypothetical protein AFR_16335 [Actinoplanes friuliensis DSM 7358]